MLLRLKCCTNCRTFVKNTFKICSRIVFWYVCSDITKVLVWFLWEVVCSLIHHSSEHEVAWEHLWQSQIEIEYYSVVYFERITEFDAL